MKKIILCSLVAASLLFAQGEKPAELTQADISSQNQISDASMVNVEPKSVQDSIDDFANNMGIDWGITDEKQRTFYYGTADIPFSQNDSDFAKAAEIGYNKAMISLQGNFIRDAFGKHAGETISSYEKDDSTNKMEFEELPKGGTMKQIFDKVTQLAGAKLDNELKKLGVEVEGLTEERKKTLYAEKFTQDIMQKAFGSMSGLVPVQTYIAKASAGDGYEIGVVAVMSKKTRDIARDMRLKRPSLITGKGKKITEFLPKDKEGFLQEYGLRLVYDETGAPVLLSYGRWGISLEDTKGKFANRKMQIAENTALNKADQAIQEFMNVNLSFSDSVKTGEILEETITQKTNLTEGGEQVTSQAIANIIDQVSQKIRATTRGDIRGTRTIRRWNLVDENGIPHVGVVRAYSYASYKNTTDMISNNNDNGSASQIRTETQPGNTIERKSRMVNTIDDF